MRSLNLVRAARPVFVTGGAGFIGAAVVRELLAAGRRVVVLDDLSSGTADNLPLQDPFLRFVRGSILCRQTLRRHLAGSEVVIHLAARNSISRSWRNPKQTYLVNTEGTRRLLDIASGVGVRRFVLFSSASVYGYSPPLPTPETSDVCRVNPYAVSKIEAEQLLRRTDEMERVILRPFNVFGPGQQPELRHAAVIPRFAWALLHGRAPTVFGRGEQRRDFTFVDDVARATVQTLDCHLTGGFEAFNLAAGRPRSVTEVLEAIEHQLGLSSVRRFLSPRDGDQRDSHGDIRRAVAMLDFQQTPFPDALETTLAWLSQRRHAAPTEPIPPAPRRGAGDVGRLLSGTELRGRGADYGPVNPTG